MRKNKETRRTNVWKSMIHYPNRIAIVAIIISSLLAINNAFTSLFLFEQLSKEASVGVTDDSMQLEQQILHSKLSKVEKQVVKPSGTVKQDMDEVANLNINLIEETNAKSQLKEVVNPKTQFKNVNKRPTAQILVSTGDKKSQQQPERVPMLPWEQVAAETRLCKPSERIPNYCCPGSYSAGGRSLYNSQVCNNTEAYQKVEDYAINHLHSEYAPYQRYLCDICIFMDYLFRYSLTLSFVGDSLTSQIVVGFECELRRRGYEVETKNIQWKKRPGCSWRHCIGSKTLYTIKDEKGQLAKIYYYGCYRPDSSNMDLKEEIIPHSDIVVFDHGLHWKLNEKDIFAEEMLRYLKGFRDSNLTLLAWRETSAQHFDSPGGHYPQNQQSNACVPITSSKEAYRRPIMEQSARDAGFKWKNILDKNFSETSVEREELVFLPFRKYTVPLDWLHPNECTHYCHSPFLWLQVWRNLRIALDRALGVNRNVR